MLTSPEHIANRKAHARNVTKNKLKQAVKKLKITKITKRRLNKERKVVLNSTSESEGELSLKDESDTPEE